VICGSNREGCGLLTVCVVLALGGTPCIPPVFILFATSECSVGLQIEVW